MKLIIDLAFKPTVALLSGNNLSIKTRENEHSSDEVMKDIDEILKENKTNIEEVDTLCVNLGPGSFTGIRVGVAIAKGLNILGDKKIEAFTSFDLIGGEGVKVVRGFSNFVYVSGEEMDCVQIGDLKKDNYVTIYDDVRKLLSTAGLKVKRAKQITYDKVSFKEVSREELRPLYLRKSQAELLRESKLKNAK